MESGFHFNFSTIKILKSFDEFHIKSQESNTITSVASGTEVSISQNEILINRHLSLFELDVFQKKKITLNPYLQKEDVLLRYSSLFHFSFNDEAWASKIHKDYQNYPMGYLIQDNERYYFIVYAVRRANPIISSSDDMPDTMYIHGVWEVVDV